jgi:Arc/MetJ family transcription regulator
MCDILHKSGAADMATNLAIDDRLIDEALRLGNHGTKKAAVTAALKEYIARRKQVKILELSGSIDYDPAYDYREMRRAAALS